MEKIVRQGMLFDTYGELLTKHQRSIYEDVVYGDLSLSEAADTYGITRQGIHDLIKRCDKILEGYESKLGIVEKSSRIEALCDRADEIINNSESLGKSQKDELKTILSDIKNHSKQ